MKALHLSRAAGTVHQHITLDTHGARPCLIRVGILLLNFFDLYAEENNLLVSKGREGHAARVGLLYCPYSLI
jgi:hypothetical protein